jgi:hypothetical protein
MEEELDPFDFVLAETLHMTLADMDRMSNREYVAWRAFHNWRAEMRKMESQ